MAYYFLYAFRLERFADGKHNLHFKYKDEFNKMVEDFLTS